MTFAKHFKTYIFLTSGLGALKMSHERFISTKHFKTSNVPIGTMSSKELQLLASDSANGALEGALLGPFLLPISAYFYARHFLRNYI